MEPRTMKIPAFTKRCTVITCQETEGAFIFCRIPGYLSVIKADSLACPHNPEKQSRFSCDLFLIPTLVGVAWGRQNMASHTVWICSAVFVGRWCGAVSSRKQTHVQSVRGRSSPGLSVLNSEWRLQTSAWRLVRACRLDVE